MGFDTLPPWLANEWFALPTAVQVPTVGGATTKLCKSDPMRVGLILSAAFGSGADCYVGPTPEVVTGFGVHLTQQDATVKLTHNEWGPLVQMDWYGANTGIGGSVTVIELSLNDWPQPDPDNNMDVRDYLDFIAEFIKGLRV